jgi:uncharacterized protein
MLTKIQTDIILRTSQFVQNELLNIESGHDWWHTWRVWQIASHLAQKENADIFICSLAALLHDVSDPKFTHVKIEFRQSRTEQYIYGLGLEESIRNTVLYIVENISFGAGIARKFRKSIEFEVVQDADRLDAIGAIGIARAFNYGGFKNRSIHLPGTSPAVYSNTMEYRLNNSTTIIHFYEKLLSLKAIMNTHTAKIIANERNQFMVDFLDRFFFEWDEFSETS